MLSLFPWIVGAFCAPCFFIVIRLIDVTNTLRSDISEAKIWSDDAFPRGIAEIEKNPEWRLLVNAYYSDIDRIYREVTRYLLTNIFILVGVLIISLVLEQGTLDGETKILVQLIYCMVGMTWLFFMVSRFAKALRFKSNIKVTINAIKQDGD